MALPAMLNPDPLPRTAKRIEDALAKLRAARRMCEHDPHRTTCVRCETEERVLNVSLEFYGDLLAHRRVVMADR